MSSLTRVRLTAPLIEAFSSGVLSENYDNPQPTPDFHREGWELCCSDESQVAIAAPRGHAKSTAFTHAYGLAAILFREEDYVMIVSATEELAIQHLGDIGKELRENEELRQQFLIHSLPTDAKTEIVVRFADGHEARIVAKGSGQKLRGVKWRGKRPGLILCDDLEEDEQVESKSRRIAFGRWFNRALIPALRKSGKIRVYGTVLHLESLLARLLKSKAWATLRYRAHRSFDDFTDILWPEQFPKERLMRLRQTFIDDGDAAGYSQEYLNDPLDHSEAFLRRQDFLPMSADDHAADKIFLVGCDFAASKATHADNTSFTIGGKSLDKLIHIVDERKDRWASNEWLEEMFSINERWHPFAFVVEGGVIWKTIEPILYDEMLEREVFLNLIVINPVKDKATRGQAYRNRHRAGGMRFDKETEWYPAYEEENLRFTPGSDGVDDQFDSTAILVKGFEQLPAIEVDDFESEEEEYLRLNDPRSVKGRSATTGY